jgi:amino-acid N-acetyltransferase
MSVVIRPAKTADVKTIRAIVDTYAVERKLLSKSGGEVVGCGALHVLWEDIAEVRTVAVVEQMHGKGVGHLILENILARAKEVGVKKVFCLTFETKFFGSHGFKEIQGAPVEPEIYTQLLRSYDEGIAEFLDLESVKPNTLGNTRMLKIL